jgi:hypothetical protein
VITGGDIAGYRELVSPEVLRLLNRRKAEEII